MPCEHFENALIESAATGAESQGELRAHLGACAACRAAFAEEQSLFSSIDSGLHATSNAEVPASLLPRVRARLDEAAAPVRSWRTVRFVLAGATAIIIVFFAAQVVRRTSVERIPTETATKTSPLAPVMQPPQSQNSVPVLPTKKNSVPEPRAIIANNSVPLEILATRGPGLEVLVPQGQEALLMRYAEQWRSRKRAPLVAENLEGTTLAPLQIAPIQIAQLDVKLLSEEHAQ